MIKNNPDRTGQVAGDKHFFGEFNRYACYPVHTRGESIQWFTVDAETLDEFNMPAVIRQADNLNDAIDGLK